MARTSPETKPARSDRLGVIDVGSNSIRLVVAELSPGGGFRILDEERESTRLAKALSSTGRLGPRSIDESLDALRRFQSIAEGFQVSQLRTIATCAVREAQNGNEFCQRAKAEARLDIDVISDEEEAQLAYRSVLQTYDISDKNVAIADVGGGSTEIVLVSENHIEEIYSTPLGAVRLTEMFCSPGLFGDDYKPLIQFINRQLKKTIRKPPFPPQILFGSGGTFTNLGSMLRAARGDQSEPKRGYRVTRAEVRHLLDRLQKMTLKQRRSVPGLNSDRADIIVAGVAVVDLIMRRLKVNVLRIHQRGVRDGMLWSMIDQRDQPTTQSIPHDAGLEQFVTSCGADLSHVRHVAKLAGAIFSHLAEPFQLHSTDRTLLESAAMLQDVGYLINYDRHHKHSYHLILNSQLPGFSRHELELVANVARYHRGARPKRKHPNLQKVSREERTRVRQLAAILRIAGGLDRSHSQRVQSVTASVFNGRTSFQVTAFDDVEVDVWSARRRTQLFEKIFRTKVSIHVGKPDPQRSPENDGTASVDSDEKLEAV